MALYCTATAITQIEKLQAKRVAEGKKPALGLRIGIRGGGCNGFGYVFEWCDTEPRATDRIFEFAADGSLVSESTGASAGAGDDCTPAEAGAGKVRIFCDPKSLIYLDNTTLDYVTGLMGHGFKFENPNAKGSCGCGESVQF
jgi:iron-sulfur cluster assembly protein